MSPEAVYLTKADAARTCGVSESTIQRYRRDGKLPNARTASGGVLEVAVADLVAAGLLDALAGAGPVEDVAARTRTERDLLAARQQLAVTEARLAGVVAQLDDARAEITFLRRLLNKDAA